MLRIPVGFFAALPQARNVTVGPKGTSQDSVSRDTVETFRALLHAPQSYAVNDTQMLALNLHLSTALLACRRCVLPRVSGAGSSSLPR